MKKHQFLFIMTLFFVTSSCENAREKQRRYEEELNVKFDKSLPSQVKKTLINLFEDKKKHEKQTPIVKLKLNGKICAVSGSHNFYKENKILLFDKTVIIDHSLTEVLLSRGYQVSFDIKELDYLIFTDTELEEVGYYVNSEGKRTDSASIPHNFIYVYNLKENKLSFVTVHKGGNPEKYITQSKNRIKPPFGKIWYSQDYINFLEEHEYLNSKGKEQLKIYSASDYVEYLEDNNFLGLSD